MTERDGSWRQRQDDTGKEPCFDKHVVINGCRRSLKSGVCVCVSVQACMYYLGVLPLVKSVTTPGLKIAPVRMQSYLYSSHTLSASFNASLLECVRLWLCVYVTTDWAHFNSCFASLYRFELSHSFPSSFSSSLFLCAPTTTHTYTHRVRATFMNEWMNDS